MGFLKKGWRTFNSMDPLDLTGTKARGAAEKQERAQEVNLGQQQGIYKGNQTAITAGTDQATGAITGYGQQAGDALSSAYGQQQGLYGQAGGALQQGLQGAQSQLASGYGQARSDLGGVDTSTALGANFEQDPGYQFRLQQGQQALDRSQAAAGGRYSGAALKAGMNYNQGMASQEFGNAAARDAQLRGMQMQQGQGMSNLAMGYGQNQADLSSQQGSNMANLYGQQAGAAQQYGQNKANLYGDMGSQLSGAYQNQIGYGLQNAGQLSQAYNNYAQVPGMSDQAGNNAQKQGAGTVLQGAGTILSVVAAL